MDWVWPKIGDSGEAIGAATRAAMFAFVVAGITALTSGYVLLSGDHFLGLSGYGLIDAALFAIVGWRLPHHSFLWAIFGTGLYALEQVAWIMRGHFPGIFPIIIMLGLISGVRATYFLRKDRQ